MQITAKIQIDREAAKEFNRRLSEQAKGDTTFFEFLEERIRLAVEQIDEFGHVEILST